MSSYELHVWCHWKHLERIGGATLSTQKWKQGLAQRIAALEPDTVDAPCDTGITALGLVASARPLSGPVEEVKGAIAQGVEQLLAAGANPLAGRIAAILNGLLFQETPAIDRMLSALIAAQRAGKPYQTASGGNLLHAMANTEVGLFSRLAQDKVDVLLNARDVVSTWCGEVDAQGMTPIDLAWERYPSSHKDVVETRNEAASTWSLLLQGPKGIWQPPPLDMQCADGSMLYQRVLMKVDQGMPVPRHAEKLVAKLRAMALRDCLDQDTPFPSSANPLRSHRL